MTEQITQQEQKQKEWVAPSESECDYLKKKIMKSVYPIIIEMKNNNSNEEYDAAVRSIFNAIEVANTMQENANREFSLSNPDSLTHSYYFDIMPIIATCVVAAILDYDDISKFPPYSLNGQHIMAFSIASRILSAASNLESELEMCGEDHGWELAKKIIYSNKK